MTTDSGGNPRSKGKGMQWKTGWGSKKPFDLQMPFFERFLTARFYLGAPGQGLPGSGGGFWVGAVFFERSAIVIESVASFGDGATPTQGWSILAFNGKVRFSIGDGAALTTIEQPCTPSDPDQLTPADVIPVMCVYDKTNALIKLYSGSPTVVGSTPFVGPYATPGAGRTSLGGFYTGVNGGVNLGINGLAGGNFIPTVPEITAWFAAVKSGLKIATIPAKTSHRWAANDFITPPSAQVAAPITIPDDIASTNLAVIANAPGIVITEYGTVFSY